MSNSSYCVAKTEGRLKAAGSGPAEPQRRVAGAGAASRSGQLCGKASPERAGRGGMTAAPPQERNEPPPSTPHTCWHLLPEETAAGGQRGRCRPSLLSSSETKRLTRRISDPEGNTKGTRAEEPQPPTCPAPPLPPLPSNPRLLPVRPNPPRPPAHISRELRPPHPAAETRRPVTMVARGGGASFCPHFIPRIPSSPCGAAVFNGERGVECSHPAWPCRGGGLSLCLPCRWGAAGSASASSLEPLSGLRLQRRGTGRGERGARAGRLGLPPRKLRVLC